jgi:hypothetical protein
VGLNLRNLRKREEFGMCLRNLRITWNLLTLTNKQMSSLKLELVIDAISGEDYLKQISFKAEDLDLPTTISSYSCETAADEANIKQGLTLFGCWCFQACVFGSAMN